MRLTSISGHIPLNKIPKVPPILSETAQKTAAVFITTVQTASVFTGQAPVNDTVKYSALAAKLGACVVSGGLLASIGPWAIIAKPVIQLVAVRVVVISGNTLYHLGNAIFTEKTFMEGMNESLNRSSTPFTVQFIGGALAEAAWYGVKSTVLPYELGAIADLSPLMKSAAKVVICTPVKQLGRFGAQVGYNLVTGSKSSSFKHLYPSKFVEDFGSKMSGEIFKKYGKEKLDLNDGVLDLFAIFGAVIGAYVAEKSMKQVSRTGSHMFQVISQLYNSEKFAGSNVVVEEPTSRETVSPTYSLLATLRAE